jgi:hypothetical protein
MALSFTNQDFVDIRRHMGYGALGDTAEGGSSLMFYRFYPEYKTLEWRMSHLTDEEVALVQGQYLPNLNALEQDIYGVRNTLTASQAAVYTHNDHEMSDRVELFTYFRKQLCAFFQLPSGPFMVYTGASGMRFVH